MTNGNGGAGTPQRSTLPAIVETVLAATGAVATFVALWEYYGLVGALVIPALALLAIGLDGLIRRDGFRALVRWSAWRQHTFSAIACVIGAALLLVALFCWWAGWMRLSFGLASFPHEKYVLQLADLEDASNRFGPDQIAQLQGDPARQDAFSKQAWIQWMLESFAHQVNAKDQAPTLRSLVYIESVPFEDDYDTFTTWVEADPTVTTIDNAVAFLVAEGSNGIWYKPRFRQLDVVRTGENGTKSLIILDKPTEHERLVVFVAIRNRKDAKALPDIRQSFPNPHHLEVK